MVNTNATATDRSSQVHTEVRVPIEGIATKSSGSFSE